MQYVTVRYTDGVFDQVGGSSLQLHLLELVERIEVGRGPVGEYRTSCDAHLFFTGNRRGAGSPSSQGHTVRLPRDAVDRRIQMNGGDPLMLIAETYGMSPETPIEKPSTDGKGKHSCSSLQLRPLSGQPWRPSPVP